MHFYLVVVGPVALAVCGQHVHEVLSTLSHKAAPELRHAPEPGCRLCEESA
jgi:hypothetical protein